MSEPTITCPNCQHEIKLTESLAAPLIQSTKKQYEKLLAKKDGDILLKEQSLREREKSIQAEKQNLEQQISEQVEQQLKVDRKRITDEEAKKAKLAAATDMEQKTKELADLQEILKQRDEKLAEAQQAQADLIRKQRELDDAKREMDLTIEKRVQENLTTTRDQAKKETEEQMKLKIMEKEQTISSMQKKIEDLKRKAEQGSQQLQGEVQELELETLLSTKFPFDRIEPVPKGEFGGDILQRVTDGAGQYCGTILWESKRTKNWSDGWLSKLRSDQHTAKAEIAVIVSQVLPKGIETFEQIDGIWITHPKTAIPISLILRQSLIEISMARNAAEGQETKAEMVYQYLTGPRFRQRVEAIVVAFETMRDDLEKERKVITKQWAKRSQQIERVMESTVGMYGDLQGIAGKTLQEIEGLDIMALDEPDS